MPSYYISRNGIQSGPFDERSIMGQMQAGLLSPDDLCSIDGLQDWTELRTAINATAPTEPVYFYVPPSRIILFSILSCGSYELYWIYRNWRYIQQRDVLVISPFWRSTFGILYIRGLLNHIHADVRARSVETPQFSPNRLATAWICLTLLSSLVSLIPGNTATVVEALIPSFLCLVPVQQYVNSVNRRLDPNQPYHPWSSSLGHWVCLAFGLLVWGLTLADAFMPGLPD